uniref:Deoxynucleoside kinase n=1 Tax=Pithovirus LCPAC101 TaxID=2506586 RepID=A0A481Z525_9VIRU|nr:MAG: deoxynucleoside kinase [Pithovirus LCPAC101]
MSAFFKNKSIDGKNINDIYGILKGSVICIEGLVGAGKSVAGFSVVEYLDSLDMKAKYYPEYVNHALLNQYLSDMKKYAYYFQMFMLLKRISIYKEALEFADCGGISVVDRCVVGDYAFATMQHKKGYITDEDWNVYLSVMEQDRMRMPSVILYLKCPPSVAFERMIKRNIKSEVSGYTLQYLEDLNASYSEAIDKVMDGTNIVFEINWKDSKSVISGILDSSTCKKLLDCAKEKIMFNSM